MPAPKPLPDSPDLDQLRKQAKDLLRAAHNWQEAVFADLTAGWPEQDVRQLQGYLERLLDAQHRKA